MSWDLQLLDSNYIIEIFLFLQIQPNKRISSEAALRHTYFDDLPQQIYELDAGKDEESPESSGLISVLKELYVHWITSFPLPQGTLANFYAPNQLALIMEDLTQKIEPVYKNC